MLIFKLFKEKVVSVCLYTHLSVGICVTSQYCTKMANVVSHEQCYRDSVFLHQIGTGSLDTSHVVGLTSMYTTM